MRKRKRERDRRKRREERGIERDRGRERKKDREGERERKKERDSERERHPALNTYFSYVPYQWIATSLKNDQPRHNNVRDDEILIYAPHKTLHTFPTQNINMTLPDLRTSRAVAFITIEFRPVPAHASFLYRARLMLKILTKTNCCGTSREGER